MNSRYSSENEKSIDRLEVHMLDGRALCYTIKGVAPVSMLYSNEEVLL